MIKQKGGNQISENTRKIEILEKEINTLQQIISGQQTSSEPTSSGAGKKTNKRNNKVLKRTNKKIGGSCQNLALVNNKLNIYAHPQISQGTTRSFTGNHQLNGSLPRGSTVARGIEQVNLRKNVFPGGKRTNRRRNNNKKSVNKKR